VEGNYEPTIKRAARLVVPWSEPGAAARLCGRVPALSVLCVLVLLFVLRALVRFLRA